LHAAFEWLTDQVDGLGMIEPRMNSYIGIIIKFEVLFGLAFELPLVIFYLVIFDVIPYKKLRSSWRTVYVALMVICAVITPDASPITMLLLFAAMIALYEISLLAARVVLAGRIKKQNAELAKEGSEE
jgi:sec-independent protein translocase protein TatC